MTLGTQAKLTALTIVIVKTRFLPDSHWLRQWLFDRVARLDLTVRERDEVFGEREVE